VDDGDAIFEVYGFYVQVLDIYENALEGVDVTCTAEVRPGDPAVRHDAFFGEPGTVQTTVGGALPAEGNKIISQKFLGYGGYQNDDYTYIDHRFTFAKDGYQTLEITLGDYDIRAGQYWTVHLQPAGGRGAEQIVNVGIQC
jgi:hypothetical protein